MISIQKSRLGLHSNGLFGRWTGHLYINGLFGWWAGKTKNALIAVGFMTALLGCSSPMQSLAIRNNSEEHELRQKETRVFLENLSKILLTEPIQPERFVQELGWNIASQERTGSRNKFQFSINDIKLDSWKQPTLAYVDAVSNSARFLMQTDFLPGCINELMLISIFGKNFKIRPTMSGHAADSSISSLPYKNNIFYPSKNSATYGIYFNFSSTNCVQSITLTQINLVR